jgi:multidrug efflux pump subunit AcrB
VLARFFIDRPIFAWVISIVIALAGLAAVYTLPIAQYPDITPPTIQVACSYPGASAVVVQDTVAAPIEEQVNGVENMLYMSSQSNNDGSYALTVTFEIGVDLNMAQVLVQNRVAQALPRLPQEVQAIGVTVKKRSPDILLAVNVFSDVNPETGQHYFDQLYVSNYATLQLQDELARVKGVGDITLFGQQNYSMRVWVDPDKLASRSLTAGDVVNALREQNVQVPAGQLGRPPAPPTEDFQYTVVTQGRLTDPEQFADIVLKTDPDGAITYLRDVARVQLGAQTLDTDCRMDGQPSVGAAVFLLPGSNALDVSDRVKAKMRELGERFPRGLRYIIAYDTTPFIRESVNEVFTEEVESARVSVFPAPPIRGLGNTGGFKLMVQDRGNLGLGMLQGQADNLAEKANANPGLVSVFNSFRASTPQLYLEINRPQVKSLQVPLSEVNQTLQVYLGGYYVNDFNFQGRVWQVNVQAEAPYRLTAQNVQEYQVRNAAGGMVPLGTVVTPRDINGPLVITRYNMYPAAAVNGGALSGVSTGTIIRDMEALARENLPESIAFEWTELIYMQILAGGGAIFAFVGAVVLVFLVLAAQYESWSLPLSIILVVPMCLLCALAEVVLVGLACKNAILIVQFARDRQLEGRPANEAAVEASTARLRPIIMTSFAFILGVFPLVVATGAGAEMRRTLGAAVFAGMFGVTLFGIFLTPVFYFVIGRLAARGGPPASPGRRICRGRRTPAPAGRAGRLHCRTAGVGRPVRTKPPALARALHEILVVIPPAPSRITRRGGRDGAQEEARRAGSPREPDEGGPPGTARLGGAGGGAGGAWRRALPGTGSEAATGGLRGDRRAPLPAARRAQRRQPRTPARA